MNYLLSHPKLEKKLRELGSAPEVPALPELYIRIREIINSPAGSSAQASELISKDPSLVMKILRTVNSPAFGLRQPVTKLDQAVTLIGFNEISNLVLAATVLKQFPVKPGDRLLNLKKFWEHSIGVAVMAKTLLNHCKAQAPSTVEDAFIAGLIHDVGKLMMYQSFSREFTDAMNLCRTEQLTLVMAEERVFGFTHQDMGAYVADAWGFSRDLVKAIELHNTPEELDIEDASFSFVSLIHIANLLAHYQGYGNSGDPFLPSFTPNCVEALGITPDALELLLAEGNTAFAEIAGALV